MIKKIVLGVALAGLVGVLVFGAVSQTDAKLDAGTAEGRSAQGYGQPEGDGPDDQQGGRRRGQADGRGQEGPHGDGSGYGQESNQGRAQQGCDGDCDGDGPDHDQQGGPRHGRADGRAQEGPYGPGSGPGYGQEGRPGRGQQGFGTPADCDEDCDCDGAGPGHGRLDQRPHAE